MTRFTPHTTDFSLFLLDKSVPRHGKNPQAERDEPGLYPPVWRLPQPLPHAHQDHEINIVTGGTCRYIWSQDGKTNITTVSVGEMFIIPGGVEHIVEVDRFATVRGVWIHPGIVAALPAPATGAISRLRNFDQPLPPRLVASVAQNTLLQELFEQAQAEHARSNDPLQTETLRVLGRLAAISFVRLMISANTPLTYAGQSPAEARVGAVRAFVDRNYLERLSLARMADMACLSASQFSLLFRQQTGESPKAYLLVCRLNHVATMLASSDLPISQIAWNTGFADLAGFNHRFKTYTGSTPGAYRKKHQKER
ncbi:MAG: helix-turn-helix transcriptional regulator [Fibrella sp.]|nr:helix-turn-helix transcriptional regulator [Armatimonadota bacterium]